MNRQNSFTLLCSLLILVLASTACSQKDSVSPESGDTGTATFIAIHFEAGYKGRIFNDLPVDLPAEYLGMEFGWQEYYFETAQNLIQKADEYGFHLTLEFNPQWAEYILQNSDRTDMVRQWQAQGHEIAFHHHSLTHPDWNGYSNDVNAMSVPIYLGDVDAGLDLVRNLAAPQNVITSMMDGLPIDMPQSHVETTIDLISTGGNQYDSFEQYGELRSLRPTKVINANGTSVVRLAHRQLTWMSDEISIEEALEIFKTEYTNIEPTEIYGVVFHCFDYLAETAAYDEWFAFIAGSGDVVKTTSEVVAEYEFDIPTDVQSNKVRPFDLHGAHPNPFNPQTTIAFEVSDQADIKLSVFDVSGRVVKTLIDFEPVARGRHDVVWDGRDATGRYVASGAYFYRLESGGYVESGSLALIK